MNKKLDTKCVKIEPEVIICHNNDDVELALDPFADNGVLYPIKEEYVEPVYENLNVEDVQIIGFSNDKETSDTENITFDYQSDDSSSNYFTNEPFPTNHSNFPISSPSHVDSKQKISSIKQEKKVSVDKKCTSAGKVTVKSETTKQKPKSTVPGVFPPIVTAKKEEIDSDSDTEEQQENKTRRSTRNAGNKKKTIDSNEGDDKKKRGRPRSQVEHKCGYCGKCFQYASLLKLHTRTHMDDKGHNCPVCKKSFARSDHCKQHLNHVHAGEIIDGVLRKPTFEQKCEICDKVFHHSGNLRKHMILHTGERPFTCEVPDCGKTFVLAQHLKSHTKLVHTDCRDFQCSICGKLFNHSGNYRKHMKVHSGERPYSCQLCDKTFAQTSNYQAHMRVHMNDRPFKCDQCDRAFAQQINLTLHKRVHTGEKPFECPTCQRKFRRKSQCTVHMKVHSDGKAYRCKQCTRQFTHYAHLKSHEKLHSTEPRFKCLECDKAFIYNHQLVLHVRWHTGERPFTCDICDAAFVSLGKQRRHMKMQHDQEFEKEEKTHTCTECSKVFRDKRLLSNHMRIHQGIKPFKCDFCDKRFITKCDCKKHMRVHTGEKPYRCEICSKRFTFSNSYRIHMRNHTGEKPFECNVCGKAFACSSDRGKHVKLHNQTSQSNITDKFETVEEVVI